MISLYAWKQKINICTEKHFVVQRFIRLVCNNVIIGQMGINETHFVRLFSEHLIECSFIHFKRIYILIQLIKSQTKQRGIHLSVNQNSILLHTDHCFLLLF